jgi:lipoate-protein ligase A
MFTRHSQMVKVDRQRLLEVLKQNREKHSIEYAQAIKDYRVSLLQDLTAAVAALDVAATPQQISKVKVQFEAPENHDTDFREAIEIFEESVQEHIELDGDTFRQFFKNQWAWRARFQELAGFYNSKALG